MQHGLLVSECTSRSVVGQWLVMGLLPASPSALLACVMLLRSVSCMLCAALTAQCGGRVRATAAAPQRRPTAHPAPGAMTHHHTYP